MEQLRLVIAVVLSILVFLIWDLFFVPDAPRPPARQEKAGPEAPAGNKGQPYSSEESADGRHSQDSPSPRPAADSRPENGQPPAEPKTVPRQSIAATVSTPLYSLDISTHGAGLIRFDLEEYREDRPETSPRKSLIAKENPAGTVVFDLAGADIPGLETGRYESDLPAADITVDEAPRTATFSRRTDSGVVVEKKYTFYPDSYLIGLDVVVKNDSDQAIAGQPAVTLNRYFVGEGSRFVFEGPCAYVNQRLKKVKIKDIPEESRVEGPLTWMAIENRYFMSSLIPETGMDGSMDLAATESRGNNLVTARHLGPSQTVPPQSIKTYHYNVFMGPKNINILKQIGFNLDKAVNFGWFDVVARPCLWLMNKVYQIIPNYGVAIIVLTLIIKLIFWPLGNKSYKSMAEMKKIQPLMAEVREKYKDDKKKMNEEMMALYKTYKVNPLGGCLPMIVQIPVFIAFYRMLYQAIELRHAPFMLWINDLSAPERLFSFDISVPLMQPPIGIPVMTIIMGATMFLQQKLQPTPGDPAQAKMMMLMPVFLTVIFINFPSGLVLYFIVNNLVSIAQQHYVTSRNN